MNWIVAFGLAVLSSGVNSAATAPLDDAMAALRRGDPALALSVMKPLAEQGASDAENGIGMLYRDGLGVARDDAEAIRWFRKAAAQGYGPAQANLGHMLETGRGGARNEREAADWYRRAFERRAGAPPAPRNFSDGLAAYDGGRVADALEIWRPLGEQGHLGAQFNVAVLYEEGNGVRPDPAEAARWFLMAAYQGDVDAQLKVGEMYEAGRGLPQDAAQARRWYATIVASPRVRDKAPAALDRARARLEALAHVTQEAAEYEGGRLVLARDADGVCVIAVQGLITYETRRKFDEVMKRSADLGCASPWLLLESPGGLSDDGLRLGREVRDRKLRTMTRLECASACSTIFLGGVERVLMGPAARIGLHQGASVRATGERWCANTVESNGVRELRNYLRTMIPATATQVANEIMNTSCNSITWVAGERALELGIATRLDAADMATAASRTTR